MRDFIYKKLFVYLILFQPIIDILTSFMLNSHYQITIGIISKVLMMILAIVYLLFIDKKHWKINLLYLFLLGIFSVLNLLNNQDILKVVTFNYINQLFKYLYHLVMLLFFIRWYKEVSIKLYQLRIPIMIIVFTYFLSYFTNTSFNSYPDASFKIGENGWYSSANEFGNLLCILFPISIYNAFHNKDGLRIDCLFPICLGIIMLLIGTKVGLLGFYGTLFVYILFRIIFIKKYLFDKGLIITLLMLIISLFFFTKLPCIYNIKTSADYNGPDYVLLSGRAEFLRIVTQRYQEEADSYDKLVGQSYLTKSGRHFYIIEQDFYDVYFMYGIVGLLLIVLVYSYLLYILMRKTFDYWQVKKKLSIKCLVLLITICLELGVAFMAGHSLLSPSVSTYLTLLMAMIINIDFNYTKYKKQILVSKEIKFINEISHNKYEIMYLTIDKDSKDKVVYPYYHYYSLLSNKYLSKIFYNRITAYLLTRNKKYDIVLGDNQISKFASYYLGYARASRKLIVGKKTNKMFKECISEIKVSEI